MRLPPRVCAVRPEWGSYWYYVDDSSLHYAISRALWHGVRALDDLRGPLVEKALARQRPDGSFGNELCTAWTLSTLLNAGSDDRDSISGAVGCCSRDSGWTVGGRASPHSPVQVARATHLSLGLRGAHGRRLYRGPRESADALGDRDGGRPARARVTLA